MEDDAATHADHVRQLVVAVTGTENPFVSVPLEPTHALLVLGPMYYRVLRVYKDLRKSPRQARDRVTGSSDDDDYDDYDHDDVRHDDDNADMTRVEELWNEACDKESIPLHAMAGVGVFGEAAPFAADSELVAACETQLVRDFIAPCLLRLGI